MVNDKNQIQLGGTARSPEDVIELHELGLQFAEIPITDPEKFLLRKDEYLSIMDELGIYYLCHGPREGDPNDVEALERKYLPKLMNVLSVMPELEMRLLTMHLWMDPRFVTRKVLDYKIVFLERLIQKAGNLGIVICIENLSESAEGLSGAFNALPLLNLTLDVGHAQLLTKENTSYGFMKKYPERIKHIHLHDNRGGSSPNDDLHLPVGEGTIDLKGILLYLRSIGFKRTITLELRPGEIERCLEHVKQMLHVS